MNLRPTITLWNYIIKEHIGPFLSAVAITTFIILMDKIFDLLDLIIGKGLSITVVGEIFFLSLGWIVALTIPMAVLVATLMAFGRLSEDNEIIAMKAGGISIIRMIVPVLIASFLLTWGMIAFNDKVLPEANHRLKALLVDVNKKRPGLRLEEGLFLDEFEGYSVFVEEVDQINSELFDVIIYEYGKNKTPRIIKAKKGNLDFLEGSSTLVLKLYNGYIEEIDRNDPRKFLRSNFYSHQINIQGIDTELQRSQREYRSDREMNIQMMKEEIQKMRKKREPLVENFYNSIYQSAWFPLLEAKSYFPELEKYIENPEGKNQKDFQIWRNKDENSRALYLEQEQKRSRMQIKAKNKQINRYRVEIQKKYAVPVACIVFILIGAPLGMASKKGGIGANAGLSLAFFLIYYIFLLGGERLADRGMVHPVLAMWAANLVLGVVGIYSIIHRTREATFIDWEKFKVLNPMVWGKKLSKKFSRKGIREIKTYSNKAKQAIRQVRHKFPMLLDVYITREFVKTFLFSLLAFVMIFLFVDIFERLHRYIDTDATFRTIVMYYVYKLPWIVVLIIPIALLLACMFSLGGLSKNRELIVMKAAGISLYRIVVSPFLIGLLVSFIVLAMGELVVPYTNEKMYYTYSVEIKNRKPKSEYIRHNVFYRGTFERMYYIKNYNPTQKRMQQVLLSYPMSDSVYTRIDAERAYWKDDNWLFQKGFIRMFNSVTQEETAYPFEVTIIDYLDELPEDFQEKAKKPEEMNYLQLRAYINKLQRSGEDVQKYLVDLYLKLSFPFANFIIVLFGAPLACNTKRSGGAVGFGMSLLFAFVYWGFIEFGRAIGHRGDFWGMTISPMLAAWLGNIVFGIMGLILLYKARK